jgi:hypothetical protein
MESTHQESFTTEDCTRKVVVYHHNFFIGYPDRTFQPNGNITRAEMAAALTRALGLGGTSDASGFTDVPIDHWASSDITIMAREGFFQGDPDGTFRPNDPITRAEAAAVFLRVAGMSPIPTAGATTFSDVKATDWAAGYIEAGRAAGLLAGYPDNTFRPENYLSRAEFATLSCDALGREPTNLTPLEHIENIVVFPDVTRDLWAYNFVVEVTTPHIVTYPTRLARVITLKGHDMPLYTEGENGIITFLRVGDQTTAIVPADGIQPDGTDPEPREVKVRIIVHEEP